MPGSTYVPAPSQGTKISVTISAAPVEIKGADGVPEFGGEKGKIDTTAMSDAAKSYIGDVPDNGEYTITGNWDSRDAGQAHLASQAVIPGSTDTFTIDFAKPAGATTAAKAVHTGEVMSFKVSAQGGKQKFSSKIQINGAVTFTATA